MYSPRIEGLWSVKLSECKTDDLVHAVIQCPDNHKSLSVLVRLCLVIVNSDLKAILFSKEKFNSCLVRLLAHLDFYDDFIDSVLQLCLAHPDELVVENFCRSILAQLPTVLSRAISKENLASLVSKLMKIDAKRGHKVSSQDSFTNQFFATLFRFAQSPELNGRTIPGHFTAIVDSLPVLREEIFLVLSLYIPQLVGFLSSSILRQVSCAVLSQILRLNKEEREILEHCFDIKLEIQHQVDSNNTTFCTANQTDSKMPKTLTTKSHFTEAEALLRFCIKSPENAPEKEVRKTLLSDIVGQKGQQHQETQTMVLTPTTRENWRKFAKSLPILFLSCWKEVPVWENQQQ